MIDTVIATVTIQKPDIRYVASTARKRIDTEWTRWLRAVRATAGLDQAGLGDLVGLSRSMIASHEQGYPIPPERIEQILKAVPGAPRPPMPEPDRGPISSGPGISPAPVLSDAPHSQPGVSRRYFPILGSAGAAIFPVASADAIPEDYAEFSEDLYRSDVDRFAVIVNGDSMEPRLKSGDVILIHPTTACPSGRMVVFRTTDHEYAVKVLRRDAKGERFEAINPQYDAIEPRPDWQLVGFVVGWRRDSGRKKYIEEGDNSGLGPEVPF